VATVAVGLSAVETGLQHVLAVARARRLGATAGDATGDTADAGGASCSTQCGDHRFPIGEDGGKGAQRGYDAGKKIKGRKRHIAVDTQGFLLAVIVHAARLQDRVAARAVLMRLFSVFSRIETVFVDAAYTGTLLGWAKEMFGYRLQVVRRTDAHRFTVLPKRWIVERSLAWLNPGRRLSKDYEITVASAEAFVRIANIRLMTRRLAAL
jgi:transposase